MTYRLSEASLANLSGGSDAIQRVVRRAIQLTDVDFSVIETRRTEAVQRALYEAGKSWTLNSKHLTGQAVDLYPWVNGKTSHDRNHYDRIALAMFRAAAEEGVHLIWGGWWKDAEGNTGLDCPHFEEFA